MASILWYVLEPREPVYHGKRLSQWLDDYNRAGDITKTEPASEAIRALGTNTLPFLLASLKHADSPLEKMFRSIVRKQHRAKLPFYGEYPYRFASIFALRALGSNAAPLCPELLRLAEDRGDWLGPIALCAIGSSSIPTLERGCQSTNEAVRFRALAMIAALKAPEPPALSFRWGRPGYNFVNYRPTLVAGIGEDEPQFREMINLLDDPDPAVRRASANALSHYIMPKNGPLPKLEVASLVKALSDPATDVRLSAAKTLKHIDPVAATAAGVK